MGDAPPNEELRGRKRCAQFFKNYWRAIVTVTTPFICLPIFLCNNTEAYRCMYVVLVVAIYWVTEALPLPIASLIPVVAFPLMGIMDTNSVCKNYFKGTVMMFFGGLVLAEAIEYSNLHKRIALGAVMVIGCSLRRLHVGLILVTMFVSMWVSNTAATAMMLPVIIAVLQELEKGGMCKLFDSGNFPDQQTVEKGEKGQTTEEDELPVPSRIARAYFIGAAYGSTIGGIGTLLGTGTNLTFRGIYEGRFPDSPKGVDFLQFMFYAIPLMLIQTILIIIWLQIFYMGLFRPKSEDAKVTRIGKEGEEIARTVIKANYDALGPPTAHEIAVMILFICCMVLLFVRDPGFTTGWAKAITNTKISDDSVVIFIVILFFVIPASWEWLRFCTKRPDVPRKSTQGLITWKFINAKMPWSLIFLLGGGFALSDGGDKSGMSKLIGDSLKILGNLHKLLVLFIVILLSEALTNISSNVAIANIVLPVLAEMSIAVKIHPMYLMIPACLACSMAFHLPVGTPPNALINGYAYVSTKHMAAAGIGPSIITMITLWLWAVSWGRIVYPDSNDYPNWLTNQTST